MRCKRVESPGVRTTTPSLLHWGGEGRGEVGNAHMYLEFDNLFGVGGRSICLRETPNTGPPRPEGRSGSPSSFGARNACGQTVLSGPAPGDRLAIADFSELADGLPVSVDP
jgi:hypothetical protein